MDLVQYLLISTAFTSNYNIEPIIINSQLNKEENFMKETKKFKNAGVIGACFLFLLLIFVLPANVEAKSIYADEIEPNDTRMQAQEIQENKSTPEGFYNTELSGTYQVNGTTSSVDEDWFKVYLTKGKKYFTCGEKAFEYRIEDVQGNLITKKVYDTTERIFSFEIPQSDTYYVQIKGTKVDQTKYFFYVGGPVWGVDSIEIPCIPSVINMTGGTKTGIFDATNLNIPDDAVVSNLAVYNLRTTSVKSIVITNRKTGNDITMLPYIWTKDGLETQHLPAATMWTAEFGYHKTTSFNPVLKMYYLYPKYQ